MPGMLEWTRHQAWGLQAWELRPPLRVLPVPSSAPDHRSLELLCRLEQGLRALRLPVAVVEGLGGLRPADVLAGHRAVLARCLADVPAGSVVLLHAPLAALAVLLADSQARPLVALDTSPQALVGAYNDVKVLHEAAGLEPVVLALQAPPTPDGTNDTALERAGEALRRTCRERLGWVPAAWPLEYDSSASGALDGGASLAGWLKLLDSALILEDTENRAHDDPCRQRCPPRADQTIGVPDVHPQRHA